jgi:hypothetical protein
MQSRETASALLEMMQRRPVPFPPYTCPKCNVAVAHIAGVDYDRAVADHLDAHFAAAARERRSPPPLAPPPPPDRSACLVVDDDRIDEVCPVCLERMGTPTYDDALEDWIYVDTFDDVGGLGRVHTACAAACVT